MRELRHDRDEREQRDPGREHRQTELRVAVQLPRLGSDVAPQAVLSLRLRPGDDACVSSTFSPHRRVCSMAWRLDDLSRPRRRWRRHAGRGQLSRGPGDQCRSGLGDAQDRSPKSDGLAPFNSVPRDPAACARSWAAPLRLLKSSISPLSSPASKQPAAKGRVIFPGDTKTMNLGYIGLGMMGGPLARRIVREHKLRGYD